MEPLDFCRVKKIDEKGFGFLRSLYYPMDVFFHFSQIKNEEFREKLEKMKRGEFILYFTSVPRPDGKRKVSSFWYAIKDTPVQLLPEFKRRIILEFTEGKTNLYDLLSVFDELRALEYFSAPDMEIILHSPRLAQVPTIIYSKLNEAEKLFFRRILDVEKYADSDKKPFWYEEIVNK